MEEQHFSDTPDFTASEDTTGHVQDGQEELPGDIHLLNDTPGTDGTDTDENALVKRIDDSNWPHGVEPNADYTILPDNTIIPTLNTFYRSYHHNMQLVTQDIAPHIAARRTGKPINIWELGCSTGKDTASMAAALAVAGVVDVNIIATDINAATIEQAQQPWEYTRELLRAAAASWQVDKRVMDYFEQVDASHVQLVPALAERVTFACADARKEAPFDGTADIVVANNVFIHYQSVHSVYKGWMTEHVDALLANITRSLRPGGLFTFGDREARHKILTDEVLARHNLKPAENIYDIEPWDWNRVSLYQKSVAPVSAWPRFPLRNDRL